MKNRLFRKGYLIIFSVFMIIAVVLFAAPRIAKTYLIKHSHELTGRKLFIGKIRFNYFTGTLRIHNLQLFEVDEITPFMSFNQFSINLDYLPLLRNEIYVRYVNLDDPYVQVLQEGHIFNFSDLVKSDTISPGKEKKQNKPTKYFINHIRISRGFIKYRDLSLNHTISLDSLNLQLPRFTWNSDTASLVAGFKFVDGGGIKTSFSINQPDSTYSVNLKVDSLNLEILEPYAAANISISDLMGFYSGDLMIKGSTTRLSSFLVKGENRVHGFQINDISGRTVFSFRDLTVNLDTLDLEKNVLRISSVNLDEPMVLFELTDSANNWTTMLKLPETETGETSDQPVDTAVSGKGFSYNIPRVEINRGTVLFSDKNLKNPFEYRFDSLNLNLSGKPGMPGRISVKLSATLNNTGTISSESSINPDDPANDLDIDLNIKQFRMTDLDAYFREYFGFPVMSGLMSFSTTNKMRPRSLESTNHIYFRKFNLDKKLPEKTDFNIPLRLAIGILSDKDGIIDLKAPVRIKGDEVKIINLGRIIFRVIGNLFVKAALSPLSLISELQETDEESLQTIPLNLKDESPGQKGMKALDILSDMLHKKPLLNMNLIYCVNPDKALDSLAYLNALNDYLSFSDPRDARRENIPDSTLASFLISKDPTLAQAESNGITALSIAYTGKDRLVSQLDSLRKKQTAFISEYLESERALPFSRFRIIETTPDSIKPANANTSVRIYITEGNNQ